MGPAGCILVAAGVALEIVGPPSVLAMHEIDHRFVIEGHVCDETGHPVTDTQVLVKDVRVSEGATGFTDDRGYYKAVLHLHNDNRGDRIVVTARDQEKQATAQFDEKDVHTERKVIVDFGTGCEHLGVASSAWIYYGVGIGIIAIVAVAGSSYFKKQRRARGRGKAQRK